MCDKGVNFYSVFENKSFDDFELNRFVFFAFKNEFEPQFEI